MRKCGEILHSSIQENSLTLDREDCFDSHWDKLVKQCLQFHRLSLDSLYSVTRQEALKKDQEMSI